MLNKIYVYLLKLQPKNLFHFLFYNFYFSMYILSWKQCFSLFIHSPIHLCSILRKANTPHNNLRPAPPYTGSESPTLSPHTQSPHLDTFQIPAGVSRLSSNTLSPSLYIFIFHYIFILFSRNFFFPHLLAKQRIPKLFL